MPETAGAEGMGMTQATGTDGTLLLYAPVPLFRSGGEIWLERQAVNGLRLWAANFDRVTVMMPLAAEPPPAGWIRQGETAGALDRVRLEPVPMAFRPDRFLRHLPATRARIRDLIGQARYLSFAIGGLFGDWGAVSCLEAHRMGRDFAVWTDRVESEVVRRGSGTGRLRRRLMARLLHRPMAMLERNVIEKAALGLFHGRATYDAYAGFSRNPHVVHNIHLSPADHIPAAMLAQKAAAAAQGPLRLCHVGRADDMKGPLDWVEVLGRVAAAGVDLSATFLGEGSRLEAMRARIGALGLGDRVAFPGFVDDRAAVLAALRAAHLFLFCHKTPESPRVLIEALASGCALAGYDGAFARDLIAGNGGGVLAPLGDVSGLAERVIALDRDRGRLAELIRRAARDGAPFTDEAVFRHRSDLIRRYL